MNDTLHWTTGVIGGAIYRDPKTAQAPRTRPIFCRLFLKDDHHIVVPPSTPTSAASLKSVGTKNIMQGNCYVYEVCYVCIDDSF